MNQWIQLPDRRCLCFTGSDVYLFFQGLITQDVAVLTKRGCLFSAFLTPKGFFHSDFFLIQKEDKVFLDVSDQHTSALLEALTGYAKLHDVQIEDVSKEYATCVAVGENIGDMLSEHISNRVDEHGFIWITDPRHPFMGARSLVPYRHLSLLPHPLLIPGLSSGYHRHRICLGIPEGAYDLVSNKSVILEYGYHRMHAISFEKGCYRGQELMARTHHLGQVRKAVYILTVSADQVIPAVGMTLFLEQEKAGVMGSTSGDMGLACLYVHLLQPLVNSSFILTYDGGVLCVDAVKEAFCS